ncbi:MAG TPA: RluA family pseudouridine synthase [Myxococcaceae bacterium]|nr:RluA family pseudouridine synthase [Myxococcaceae bacterium]
MSLVPPDAGFVDVTFTVEPNYDGWRLDRYLCEKIRRLSRTRVQRILERSLVADRPLKPSTRVHPGLTFRLRRRVQAEPDVPANVVEVYRDVHLLVLDKPAGLPIHPTARYHHNTLVKLLERRHGPGLRADPAHRLDRETSGLLVCGRGAEASRALMRAFQSGDVHKEYLAIVEGHPPDAFVVDAPIAEGTAEVRIAVRIDHRAGKPARTRFAVERRFVRDAAPFALLRCFPETGRQHQIRVHAREAGFPLVGDKIYGPDPGYFDRFSKRCLEPEAWARLRLPRHALHAARLAFPHPATSRRLDFEAPLPPDLSDFCPAGPRSAEVGVLATSALPTAA